MSHGGRAKGCAGAPLAWQAACSVRARRAAPPAVSESQLEIRGGQVLGQHTNMRRAGRRGCPSGS
jgi:hypothetical protein